MTLLFLIKLTGQKKQPTQKNSLVIDTVKVLYAWSHKTSLNLIYIIILMGTVPQKERVDCGLAEFALN